MMTPTDTLLLRKIFRLILADGHPRWTSDQFAMVLGFTNRHHLNRAAIRLGLPPVVALLMLHRLLCVMRDAHREGRTVFTWAHRHGLDPAWIYRTTRHLTGHRWSEVRQVPPRAFIRLTLRHLQRTPAPRRQQRAA